MPPRLDKYDVTGFTEYQLEVYFDYLDELRDSGVVNMFAAPGELQEDYGLPFKEAKNVVKAWMDTFSDKDALARAKQALGITEAA